ncbi:MAG: DUF4499 domain-containing protein [Actinomycetes bacterium]|jgi:hypothetical protein
MSTSGLTTGTVDDVTFVRVAPGWWISNFGGLCASGLAARRGGAVRRTVFSLAVATHVVEAGVAFRRASQAGLGRDAATRWALQTAGVGFPSLMALGRLLRERDGTV